MGFNSGFKGLNMQAYIYWCVRHYSVVDTAFFLFFTAHEELELLGRMYIVYIVSAIFLGL